MNPSNGAGSAAEAVPGQTTSLLVSYLFRKGYHVQDFIVD
jgi:hypothetical protein